MWPHILLCEGKNKNKKIKINKTPYTSHQVKATGTPYITHSIYNKIYIPAKVGIYNFI